MRLSILTWNILRESTGLFSNKWDDRKAAFHELLHGTSFDLISLQEVLPQQLLFFQELFPGYQSYGVGREDGKAKGEHCILFYREDRFQLLEQSTFWLSKTPETPGKGWGEPFPRTCSMVQLQDKVSKVVFQVYNTHLQLHPYAQIKAGNLLAQKLASNPYPQIVTGDFNCPANWPALQRLCSGALRSIPCDTDATFHFRGYPLRKLDHIFVSKHWSAERTKLHNKKGETGFPSDHFGLSADLLFS